MEWNLRVLGMGAAVRAFGNALFGPFLALFLYSVLGVSYIDIGLIIVGVGAVQLPFGLFGGLVADRVGRWRLMMLCLGLEALATAALGYAFALHSLPGAIGAAVVGGAVATAGAPAIQAYIADFAEGPERTRGYTWYRIGHNAGFSAGVSLGGVLIGILGFSGSVYVGAAVIGAGAALLVLTLARSPYDLDLARKSPPARRSPAEGADPPPSGRSIAESLRVLGRDRVALEVAIAFALAALAVGQWSVTLPLFVHNFMGISYEVLGIGLAMNGLIVVFGQSATTERVIGRRHTTIAIGGVALYVVGFLALGVAGWLAFLPVAVYFAAIFVITIGENLGAVAQTTLPSNLAPPREVGNYNGAFSTISSVGFLLAVFFGGVVLGSVSNPLLIWVYLVLPAVPAILLFRHAARQLRIEVDRA